MSSQRTRREFLEQVGLATGVLLAGYSATARGYAANETINVGCIGTGGRCQHLMRALKEVPGADHGGVRRVGQAPGGRQEPGRARRLYHQGPPRTIGPQRRRRRDHRRARPSARAADHRGLRCRQGRLRREAADARTRGSRRGGRGPKRISPHRAGRHAAAEHAAFQKGLRDRQERGAGRYPQGASHLESQPAPLGRAKNWASIRRASTGSDFSARPGRNRSTSIAFATGAGSGILAEASSPT